MQAFDLLVKILLQMPTAQTLECLGLSLVLLLKQQAVARDAVFLPHKWESLSECSVSA